MWFRLISLSIASEALYLFWASRSRMPVSESLLAGWYRPRLLEETLPFLLSWGALFLLYALAIRATSRTSRPMVTVFVFASAAAFRITLAAAAEFETPASRGFLEGGSPTSLLLDELEALLPVPPHLVRAGITIAADLVALALLPGLLRAAGLATGLALVHGWNPLVIKEVAATPRVELVLPLLASLLAVRWLQRSRRGPAAFVYGLGLCGWPGVAATLPVMTKLLGVRVLVSLCMAASAWWLAVPRLASMTEIFGPFRGHSVGASILPILQTLVRLLVSRDPMVPLVAAAAIWLAVAVRAAARASRGDPSTVTSSLLPPLGLLLFLSPSVLPWSFLPFAYLAGFSSNLAWLGFTATAPLTYLALGGGSWSFWLGFAQYFPAYASLTFVWLGGTKARR